MKMLLHDAVVSFVPDRDSQYYLIIHDWIHITLSDVFKNIHIYL